MKLLYCISLLLVLVCCQPPESPVFERINNVNEWSSIDKEILFDVQALREKNGLPELTPNRDLKIEAIKRLEYLITTGTISHDGMSVSLKNLLEKDYEYVTELLAFGYTNPKIVVKAFEKSEAHYKALLKGSHVYVGVHCLTANAAYYYIVVLSK